MDTEISIGYSSKHLQRFKDNIGALEKSIKLKRMEPYAEIIGEVFARYNTDDDKRTMMFKLIRDPEPGTTQRRKHTENVKEIAGEIADHFDWLNSDITRIMAKEHDTGHTFEGHSGEWWISSINDTYGLPNYAHNAIGARKLVYRENIYDEVEKAILQKHPYINRGKLAKIKRDLWLIVDGINCHNGEKSEYSYFPDFTKDEARFKEEIMGCYIKRGFDRSLVPATAEGSLMRLCDKISYIPFDMVDIFRNGCYVEKLDINDTVYNCREEYEKKLDAMGMPKGSLDRLINCKTEEEYDNFAREMQQHLIRDVIANTKRNNIRMSSKMSAAMHGLRDVNNRVMVDYTVLKEDHEIYVSAIKYLMNYYADILIHNGDIEEGKINSSLIKKCATDPEYAEIYVHKFGDSKELEGFAKFLSKTRLEDYNFTVESCKKALESIIDSELDISQRVATGKIMRENIQAVDDKAERIDAFIDMFMKSLDVAYNENLFSEFSREPLNNYRKEVWLEKTRKMIRKEALTLEGGPSKINGILPLHRMVAMDLAAQYLASLNDVQFFDLMKTAGLMKPRQERSLQRRYQNFDFRKEYQKHRNWDNIAKYQQGKVSSTEQPIFGKKVIQVPTRKKKSAMGMDENTRIKE